MKTLNNNIIGAFSIPGFLANQIKLNESHYLHPLFEIIVNGIQAIELKGINNGEINIYIEREPPSQKTINGDLEKYTNIISFTVSDNGEGFKNKNYEDFQVLYQTSKKLQFGCKGVGRYLAIKAFEKMEIESVFVSENGNFQRRMFRFSADNGHEEISLENAEDETKTGTKVSLVNYRPEYRKNTKPLNIAQKILEHCMLDFIRHENIQFYLHDPAHEEGLIDIRKIFSEKVVVDEEIGRFGIGDYSFDITYLKQFMKDGNHRLHYIANNREVSSIKLDSILPNLRGKLEDEERSQKYFLSAYLKSKYFDENANSERNEIQIPKKDGEVGLVGPQIPLVQITESLKIKLGEYLADDLNRFEEDIVKINSNYITDNKKVQYRHLIDHLRNNTHKLPLKAEPIERDAALHKLNFELEEENKKKVNNLLSKDLDKVESLDEYHQELDKILQNENIFQKAKLANYVVHRKTVLKLFRKFLDILKNDKYRFESELHNIIFPMKKSNNEVPFLHHNLWILDERMAFYRNIYSDVPIKDLEGINKNIENKPDLLIYDKVLLYGQDKRSTFIFFEFKRPGRKEYKEEEKDLGMQIISVVEKMLIKDVNDSRGRPIEISDKSPKKGYVVADLPRSLRDRLDLKYDITPYGTYFRYEKNMSLSIEIMTYEQLLEDAELRHKAFFFQLGIDDL